MAYEVIGRGKKKKIQRLGFQEPLTKLHCRTGPLRELVLLLVWGNLQLHNNRTIKTIRNYILSMQISNSQKEQVCWTITIPVWTMFLAPGHLVNFWPVWTLIALGSGAKCSKELPPKEVKFWHKHGEGAAMDEGVANVSSFVLLRRAIFPLLIGFFQFSSVQLLSCVWLFATPCIAAHQASLSITNFWSLLKLMSIESVIPSSHLILYRPFLLLPPIPPSIRVFSNESTPCMRWPKYWSFSFSISSSNEHPGLISFRIDRLDLLAVQGTLKSLPQHHSSKASILRRSAFFTVQLSHPYMTTGKTIALTRRTLVGK